MKKRLRRSISAALALALVLGFAAPAFARIEVNGETVPSPYTHEGDAEYVVAGASGDVLTVKGKVVNLETLGKRNTVHADNGATIEVTGIVDHWSQGDAVYAFGSTVAVGGDIYDRGNGCAIYATSHSKITVGGSVNEISDRDAVNAYGSTVEIDGNVSEAGQGDAVRAQNGSTVTVKGDVRQTYDKDKLGSAVYATRSKVRVGGDVNGPVGVNPPSSEMTVEGCVNGDIYNLILSDVPEGNGGLYIGRLAGTAAPELKDYIHYLIGLAEGSAPFDKVTITGAVSVEDGTVDGVKGKTYRYTSTSDLAGKSIVFTPKTACKEFRIEGLPAGVESAAEDGSVTLTFTDGFKGGMQNLNIVMVPELTVTVTPGDAYVKEGRKATFKVKAQEKSLKYQWYVDRHDDKGWQALKGATGTSYTTAAVEQKNDGYRYKCVAKSPDGRSGESNIAVLHVGAGPVPPTGDNNHTLLWLTLLTVSGAALFCAERKRRQYR